MKKASIIISVSNGFAIINNFFEILFSFIKKEHYEIIVIYDCCSNSKTTYYLEELNVHNKIDHLVILENKHGFEKANNIGVTLSTCNCLIFMNSDIIVTDNIIDSLVNIYYQNKYACIQPLLLCPQTNLIQSAGYIFATYFHKHALENNSPKILESTNPIKRQALSLDFCVIDKAAFWEVGGFNQFNYNGYERIEAMLRISQKYSCVLIPYLKAYHVRSSIVVKDTFVDEEQKTPYFGYRCNELIQNDYVSLIQKYLPDQISSNNYWGVKLTSLDLLTEIREAGVPVGEDLLAIQSGKIELFSLLPFSFLKLSTSILFACDNYMHLKNNSLWFQLRANKNDLIIDANGNVIKTTDL